MGKCTQEHLLEPIIMRINACHDNFKFSVGHNDFISRKLMWVNILFYVTFDLR